MSWITNRCANAIGGSGLLLFGGESAAIDASLTFAGGQISAFQVESELLYFRKHYGLTGATAEVLLSLLADGLMLLKAGTGVQHAWAVGKVFAAIRFASKATR